MYVELRLHSPHLPAPIAPKAREETHSSRVFCTTTLARSLACALTSSYKRHKRLDRRIYVNPSLSTIPSNADPFDSTSALCNVATRDISCICMCVCPSFSFPMPYRECMYGVVIKTLLRTRKRNIREKRKKAERERARLPPREAYEGGAMKHGRRKGEERKKAQYQRSRKGRCEKEKETTVLQPKNPPKKRFFPQTTTSPLPPPTISNIFPATAAGYPLPNPSFTTSTAPFLSPPATYALIIASYVLGSRLASPTKS